MHDEEKREIFRTYIRELKPYVIASTLLLFLSTIAGYISYGFFPDYALESLSGLNELAEMLQGLTAIEIMVLIFMNNAVKMLMSIVLGVLFGLVPLLFLIMNGFVLGVFIHLQIIEEGPLFIIAGLMPHGIIEIPMLLVSSAIGFKLGHRLFQQVMGKDVELRNEFIRSVKFYLHWIFPLVLVAAVIETFITPLFIHLVSGI